MSMQPPIRKPPSDRRMATIMELACSLIGQRSLKEEAEVLLGRARDILEADGGIIRLVAGEELVYLASVGIPNHQIRPNLPTTEGLAHEIARTRRPVGIHNVPDDELTSGLYADSSPNKFRFLSYAGAPMISGGQVIGIMGVYQTMRHREFSAEDLELLQLLANMLGAAVMNLKHFDQLRAQREEMLKAQTEMERRVAEAANQVRDALDRADAAAKAKEQFLANMSHEVRTPMNAIVGMAELLMDTPLDDQQYEHAQALWSAAQNLLIVLDDVLDLSRLDAGEMRISPEPIKLRRLLEEISAAEKARAAQRDIDVVVVVDPALPDVVVGDPGRLRQVLTNYLGNALKFTERGTIRVMAALRVSPAGGRWLRFAVSDPGMGIPADKLPLLFQRFSQVDNSATRQFGGAGLGLAICRRLAELMGGSVGVESEPKRGSTFWFEIPLQAVHQHESSPANPTPEPDLSHLSFLVVEDIAVNRKIIEQALRAAKAREIFFAVDGEDCLAQVFESGEEFNVILMDCQLPRLDGLEATRRIRAWEIERGIGERVPIIALTASALPEEREKCLAAGMDDFLPKPFKRSQLYEAICSHVRRVQ